MSSSPSSSTTTSNCPICSLPLDSEELDTTPCNHTFHPRCIYHWLQVDDASDIHCPVCHQSLNHVEPGVDRMGLAGYAVWGKGGPDADVSRPDGWRAWGPCSDFTPESGTYYFNVRAPDGRWAVGCHFLYANWWNPWQTLKSVLDLLAAIPRANLEVMDPGDDGVRGREMACVDFARAEEREMVLNLGEGNRGPLLWQGESDPRREVVQARVDYAVLFSLVWMNRFDDLDRRRLGGENYGKHRD